MLENLSNQDDIHCGIAKRHAARVADNIHRVRGRDVEYIMIGYAAGKKTSVRLSFSAHIQKPVYLRR